MIEKIRKKYVNSIKKSFLGLTDMKVIKSRIEKLGYTTSRIYGHKNVKRLSASNNDKNRIEFVLSDKHLYILFSLSFSNTLLNDIILISTNKDKELLSTLSRGFEANHITNILYRNNNCTVSAIQIFNEKSSNKKETRRVLNMGAINAISETRDRIINYEINRKLLPDFSELREKTKESLMKNISKDTIAMLVEVFFSVDEPTIESIENKNFYYGYIWYKHIYMKYNFEEKDLDTFFKKFIIPYLLKNKGMLLKKYEASEEFLSRFSDSFFKDLLIEKEEDKSWFINANNALCIDSDERELDFDYSFNKKDLYHHFEKEMLRP